MSRFQISILLYLSKLKNGTISEEVVLNVVVFDLFYSIQMTRHNLMVGQQTEQKK